MEKRCRVELVAGPKGGAYCELPFDAKEAFGKARAPVSVTIREHHFRTTLARMGGKTLLGINKAHQAAAAIAIGDRFQATIALDEGPRTIAAPGDLAAALAGDPQAQKAWDALSYSHRREHVEAIEEAKKPETRARRIARALEMLRAASTR